MPVSEPSRMPCRKRPQPSKNNPAITVQWQKKNTLSRKNKKNQKNPKKKEKYT